MNIFTLMGTVLIDNAKANESLSKTGQEAEGLAGKFGASFGKIKKLAVGLGIGIAVKKSFDVASQAVTEFTDKGDDIDKMSQKFSMSAEAFQQWESIAGHNGTSMETVGRAIKEITISAEDNAEAYENMGITMKNTTDGSMRDSQDIFKDTILALSDMQAGTERDAKAKELLGSKYQELLPLINGGRDAILEQLEASESAVTMTDEQVKSAAAFKDAQQAMQEQITKVKMALTEKLIPVLVELMDWVSEHMPQIQETVDTVVSAIGGFIDGLVGVISALVTSAQTDGTLFNEVWTGIQIVFETVFKALQDIFAIFTAAFNGDWEGAWNGIKTLFSDIWNGITLLFQNNLDAIISIFSGMWDTFKTAGETLLGKVKEGFENIWKTLTTWVTTSFDGVITTVKGFGTKMFNAGKEIMSQVWEGLKNVWTDITGWIADRAEEMGKALMFWKKSKEKMDDDSDDDDDADGSHANGLSYVPFDGYKAILHKGERVLTARENKGYDSQRQGDFIINIEKIVNSNERSTYDFLAEAEFIRKQKTLATGGA